MRPLCISIHDVAPATWSRCRQLREAVREIAPHAPVTLLVVPNYHGGGLDAPPAYLDWLRACLAQGDEIALHGYTHRDEHAAEAPGAQRLARRVYTASEGEFSGLSHGDAVRRIARGRLWCASHGFDVHGFVAPAWLLGREAWDALRDFDFLYTTTLTRFVILRDGRRIVAPTVAYSARSALRRLLSRGWNRALVAAATAAPLMRVGLHPADVAHERLMRHAQGVLSVLTRTREPLTKREVARRLCDRATAHHAVPDIGRA